MRKHAPIKTGYNIHLQSCIRNGMKNVDILEGGVCFATVVRKTSDPGSGCHVIYKFKPKDKDCTAYIESICKQSFDDVFMLGQIE